MKTRLIIFLFLLAALPMPANAQDPASQFIRAYHLVSQDKIPLFFDVCGAFVSITLAEEERDRPGNSLVIYRETGYGPMLLELDADVMDGVKMDMRESWKNGGSGHKRHEAIPPIKSHSPENRGSSTLVIQSRPEVPEAGIASEDIEN
ncbi:hypothetical protein SAMN02745216_04370 [Desulfatibacillum alkenivorans DSM 16219]|jgi:hypothetical protein|uniref:Stringent starvation protein B n=1 Tax=Desulfatibacillum alkenivorans DSM 16219 TaxID=1121393 RepID=A0A1M6WPC4_9BACT|nr:hypothetical protein [Desulfatibacillum alkenivorans]SHK95538.1 hypothetical protein SAMN02745216_04370 [Desulfatibacillum alkenivorans DSM 16219]